MEYLLFIWIFSLLLLDYSFRAKGTSLLALFFESKDMEKYFVALILIFSAPIMVLWELYEQYINRKD